MVVMSGVLFVLILAVVMLWYQLSRTARTLQCEDAGRTIPGSPVGRNVMQEVDQPPFRQLEDCHLGVLVFIVHKPRQ